MSAPTSTATSSGSPLTESLLAALPGWVVARVLVVVAWAVNAVLVDRRLDGVDPQTTAQGLFAWDGAYYRDIAELGYGNVSADAIRFHPLLAVVGWNGFGILVVAWVGALLAAMVVHRLVVEVVGDRDAARRAATLVGLASPAFCLVWAYAEGPFIALAAGQLLALRWRRWWWAGLLGALAALTRPAGLFLAIPAFVELALLLKAHLRQDRAEKERDPTAGSLVGGAATVLGPVVGTLAFLLWAGQETGNWLEPLDVQDRLRGGFVFPPWRLVEGLGELVTDPFGDGLHTPFAFGMVALVVVCWRLLPWSWAALATASVVVNLAAENLNSIERYAYGTVPLLVALAVVCGGRWWRPTIVVSSIGFVGMTALAWYGRLVP